MKKREIKILPRLSMKLLFVNNKNWYKPNPTPHTKTEKEKEDKKQ